jgi:hypothetical protein
MAQAGNVILGRFDELIRMYKAPPAHALTEEFYADRVRSRGPMAMHVTNGMKLRAVWDGSHPKTAGGIQTGFNPDPDTGWKPMLHCSPACRVISGNAS